MNRDMDWMEYSVPIVDGWIRGCFLSNWCILCVLVSFARANGCSDLVCGEDKVMLGGLTGGYSGSYAVIGKHFAGFRGYGGSTERYLQGIAKVVAAPSHRNLVFRGLRGRTA